MIPGRKIKGTAADNQSISSSWFIEFLADNYRDEFNDVALRKGFFKKEDVTYTAEMQAAMMLEGNMTFTALKTVKKYIKVVNGGLNVMDSEKNYSRYLVMR